MVAETDAPLPVGCLGPGVNGEGSYTRRTVLTTAVASALAGCTDGGTGSTVTDTTARSHSPRTAESTSSDRVRTTSSGLSTTDVAFRETPEAMLELGLYLPASGSNHPFVVWAHGGGWITGDKHHRPMFDRLVADGIAVADVQYRLAQHKQYPAAVRDVTAAVKWVRDNAARYGIDGERAALGGYSAGAHLAALVGMAPDYELFQPEAFKPGVSARVDAIVGYSGPYDFTVDGAGENQLVAAFFGSDAAAGTLREGSPVTHVDEEDPPALLVHGTEDSIVPYRSTTVLATALRDADVPVEVVTGEGAGHGMIDDPSWREQTLPVQRRFLGEHLSV